MHYGLLPRAEYIAEFSLFLKKKVITTAAHYFINPARTKDNLALARKTMLPGPGISHRNSGKKKKPKQQNNPTNSRGKSSINWRESLGKTQFNYQRIVLLIAELEPAAVLAAHFSCLVTYIQNTL